MANERALIDYNRSHTLLAVGSSGGEIRQLKCDDTTGALLVELQTGDIEIGGVEIKNATDDTRAVVGAGNAAGTTDNALYVADANVKSDTALMVTALQVMDDWDATHDSAIGNDGAVVMAEARSSQPTAVANGDASRLATDLYQALITAAHIYATGKDGVTESNPLSSQYLNNAIDVDDTNFSAATHHFPSATGAVMDTQRDNSVTGKFIDADGTLTLTLEVSNDEDSTNADWNAVKFYDDDAAVGSLVGSLTVTNGTLLLTASFPNMNYRRYRWVVEASGATNTVILKGRNKAI